MAFTSPEFFLFLAVCCTAYYIAPKKFQWCVLLTVSYSFYIFTNFFAVAFLIMTTATTFLCGFLIGRLNVKLNAVEKTDPERHLKRKKINFKKKLAVFIILLINFSILAFIKFQSFIFVFSNKIFNTESGIDFILPLGISYYIFMSAGYIIDVYRQKTAYEKNILKLALFLSFFPQIVQGPIGRFDRLAEQFFIRHEIKAENFKYCIQYIMIGLFKKLVIADRAAVLVNNVFGEYKNYGGAVLFTAVIFYSMQIYCDFSGGIDIAAGTARLFGIELDKNFKRPFFALSLADFWRRWHISLGTWLKDYVFFPLVFSKPMVWINKKTRNTFGKLFPSVIATFIVYFIVGIWHGANLKYIFFGLYNGAIISVSLILEPYFFRIKQKLKIKNESISYHILSSVRTFIIICTGRFFTRADSFYDALRMIKRTYFNFEASQLNSSVFSAFGLTNLDYIILFLSAFILLFIGIVQEKAGCGENVPEFKSSVWQLIYVSVLLFFVIFFGIYRDNYVAVEFIYAGH